MSRRPEGPPRLSETEQGQLPTFGNGLSVVRLEDGSAWVRVGLAVMVRLDLVQWSPAAERGTPMERFASRPLPEDPVPGIAVRVRRAPPAPAPAPAPDPVDVRPRKGRRVDPELLERARVMVEEELRTPAAVGAVLGRTGQSILNWVETHGWLTRSRREKAHRLITVRGYTPARAAAAIRVPLVKLEAALANVESPDPRSPRRPHEPRNPGLERTSREKCPHCKAMTHQNPCDRCFERRAG